MQVAGRYQTIAAVVTRSDENKDTLILNVAQDAAGFLGYSQSSIFHQPVQGNSKAGAITLGLLHLGDSQDFHLIEHLARIEDTLGVEGVLNGFHQVDFALRCGQMKVALFIASQPMFSRDGAP
jgi:hypothetical protein